MTYREAMAAAAAASNETRGNKIACVVLDESREYYSWEWDENWENMGDSWRPIQRVWCPGNSIVLLAVPENY